MKFNETLMNASKAFHFHVKFKLKNKLKKKVKLIGWNRESLHRLG